MVVWFGLAELVVWVVLCALVGFVLFAVYCLMKMRVSYDFGSLYCDLSWLFAPSCVWCVLAFTCGCGLVVMLMFLRICMEVCMLVCSLGFLVVMVGFVLMMFLTACGDCNCLIWLAVLGYRFVWLLCCFALMLFGFVVCLCLFTCVLRWGVCDFACRLFCFVCD